MSNSLIDCFKYENIEEWSLEQIKETIEAIEQNIEAIRDSSIPLQNNKEVRKVSKQLKDYRLALLDLKQKKIHSLLNQIFCVWCESHSWNKTMTEEKKEYWYTSIRNGDNCYRFSHEILCKKCLIDWLNNDEAIVFAFPALKCPEAI
jgi:hypothetical protein